MVEGENLSSEEECDCCHVCGGDSNDEFHQNLDKVPDFSNRPNCIYCGRNVGMVAYVTGWMMRIEPSADALEFGIGPQEPTDAVCYYCWEKLGKDWTRQIKLKVAERKSKEFVGLSGYRG